MGGGGGSALITIRPTPRNSSETLVEAAIFPGLRPRRGRVIGVRLLLGRRQVVRHWILIPAFEGSIPSAPASQSVLFMANAKRENFSIGAVLVGAKGAAIKDDIEQMVTFRLGHGQCRAHFRRTAFA